MDEFWSLDVDAIAPCALENAIKEHEANLVKAKIICEGANGPITPEADEILYKKGIVVTPDVLTNAGGVTVSYFEWVQNIYGYYWTEKEVEEREERAMVDAFKPIWEMKVEKNVSFRQATYMKSIKRIAEAMRVRGWLELKKYLHPKYQNFGCFFVKIFFYYLSLKRKLKLQLK